MLRSSWGTIHACRYTESGPLLIDSEHTRRAFVGQEAVIVTIEADSMGLKKTRKWFRNNAPAEIELNRDWLARLWPGADDEGA